MSISIRIVALVVVGFLASILVGGTALRNMARINDELATVAGRDLPLVRMLTDIALEQRDLAARVERRLEHTGSAITDPELMAGVLRVVHRLRQAETVALMIPDPNPAQAEVVASIERVAAMQNRYADSLGRFIRLADTAWTDDSRTLAVNIQRQRENIIDAIGALLIRLEERAGAAAREARAQHGAGVTDTVMVSIFGLIVCVMVGLAIGRGITKPLGRITESLRRLVRGDTAEELSLPKSGVEIGEMVEAVNAFRTEIVEHRRAITALTESEKRFHTLAALSPVGVFFTDAAGECKYVNEAWCEITGQDRIQAMGAPWTDGLAPDDIGPVAARWRACAREGTPFKMEFRFRRPDGQVSWVIGQGALQTGLDGTVEGYVGTITDITARKLSEESLRHRERTRVALHRIATDQNLSLATKVQRVLELGATTLDLPLGIVSHIRGEVYRLLYVHGPADMPQPGTEFQLGETYCAHTLKASGPLAFHHAGKSTIAGHPCYEKFGLESYIGAPIVVDGQPFGTLNFSGVAPRGAPFTDADLSLVHHFADWIGHEMAAARANAAREAVAKRLETVFATVVDGIITIDGHGRIESVNPSLEHIFGYDPGELAGRNVKILMPEPYQSVHDGFLARYRETGVPTIVGSGRETQGCRKDGTVFPIDLAVNEMWIGGQRLFTGTIRDITERKRVETLKDEFVSSVSHELRTPLTSIRGALGLILGGAVGTVPESTQNLLRIAHSNSQRLIALVNDILDLQKIESGRLEFRFETLDVRAIVESAIAENTAYAEERGAVLTVVEPVAEASVQGDPARLAQVMANLLSNAAKFAAQGGTVRVSATRTDGAIRFVVADDGPGIPEDFRPRVFERFTQADSSDTRQVGGTGLGLSIAKGIVERHGGRIDFESTPGQGATFFFELPERSHPVDLPIVTTGRKGRILICEDDPDIARLLSMMLEQDGYATDIAADAEQARRLLAKTRFDAMTVDIMLPDQNGISLMQELREDPATRDLPMVVVSAKAQEARDAIENVALGVLDWLDKPIDEDRLLGAIQRANRLSGRGRPQVLHVENDRDLAGVVQALLDDIADLTVATSMKAAMEILHGTVFDLVLLDLGLPDGNGLDLLPLIKNHSARPTPVIVFSGHEIEGRMTQMV